MLFCRHFFSPLNTFMRKGKDPHLLLMDPDPGGPKTCGSSGSGSGSPTLFNIHEGRNWTMISTFFQSVSVKTSLIPEIKTTNFRHISTLCFWTSFLNRSRRSHFYCILSYEAEISVSWLHDIVYIEALIPPPTQEPVWRGFLRSRCSLLLITIYRSS